MIDFRIGDIFPKFLLNDKNGYAMAKAMEAGLNYFLEKCQEGLDCLMDPDKMPEWRLDELAWEYNCLYDYDAEIEEKREWIKNAPEAYKRHGTPDGIRQYLLGRFDEATIVEWFEEGMDECVFDLIVSGENTASNEAWIRAAVGKAKPVRDVLRSIVFRGDSGTSVIKTGFAVTGESYFVPIPITGNWDGYLVEDLENLNVEYLELRDVRMLEK